MSLYQIIDAMHIAINCTRMLNVALVHILMLAMDFFEALLSLEIL